jgi:deoxyxylulose-5-phosphate synthase
MEDHVVAGGFGSAVLEALHDADCPVAVERLGWPDKFVEHGSSQEILRAAYGLSPDDMHRRVAWIVEADGGRLSFARRAPSLTPSTSRRKVCD